MKQLYPKGESGTRSVAAQERQEGRTEGQGQAQAQQCKCAAVAKEPGRMEESLSLCCRLYSR